MIETAPTQLIMVVTQSTSQELLNQFLFTQGKQSSGVPLVKAVCAESLNGPYKKKINAAQLPPQNVPAISTLSEP